jgi:hypothetical protein
MKIMGVMMIDNVGARLDGLVEVAFEFYNRRMTLASELPKTASAAKEPRKASSVDPPFRMHLSYCPLIRSSVFYERQVVVRV